MNIRLFCKLSLSILLLVVMPVEANFNIEGKLKVTSPKAKKEEKTLSIGYKDKAGKHYFSIGNNEYGVSGRPEKYSVAIILQKNNYVWIQEFSNQLIKSFEWHIGEHKIKLKKQIRAKPVIGDYILTIDETDYFFTKNIAQLTFNFTDEGLDEIEVDGMIASIGMNKPKAAECDSEEECDEPD